MFEELLKKVDHLARLALSDGKSLNCKEKHKLGKRTFCGLRFLVSKFQLKIGVGPKNKVNVSRVRQQQVIRNLFK